MGSASVMKLLIAACLIVAVSQVHFSYAGSYTKRGSESSEDEPTGIKLKTSENATNHVDKDHDRKHKSEERRAAPAPATQKDSEEQKWTPNTNPSHFHYKAIDKINEAGQFREETVKNGEVTGYWAVPIDDSGKMWRRTDYRAGKDGFHIVSEKLIPEAEMVGSQKTNPDEANVEIDQLGGNTAYTVKGSDLKKPQQPIKRAPYNQY